MGNLLSFLVRSFLADFFLHREVHKAINKSSGAPVALKRILMHNEKEGMPVTALREIKILKALKHPCIIEILDMFVVRSEFDLFRSLPLPQILTDTSR